MEKRDTRWRSRKEKEIEVKKAEEKEESYASFLLCIYKLARPKGWFVNPVVHS